MKTRSRTITISTEGGDESKGRHFKIINEDGSLKINQLKSFCTNHIITCGQYERDCPMFKIIWVEDGSANLLLEDLINNVYNLQVELRIRGVSSVLVDETIVSFEEIGQMNNLQISRKVLELIALREQLKKAIRKIDRETKVG